MASPIARRRSDQRGAVAIMVAITVSALMITGGIVMDFGLVRWERQTNKSAADDAVMAGLQAADNGTGDVYNSSAVCGAYEFLRVNRRVLNGLPADVCATVNTSQICVPGDSTTNVAYHGTTTAGSKRFEVWIKMPYSLSDTSTGGPFTEESLTTLSADPGASALQGCDQIGVVIKEWTKPGLGKIVHSGELVTRVRSVSRVKISTGDQPPALLLLERHKCGVLTVGSGGSPSRIKVYGSGSAPGTIHADSDATDAGCGSGPNTQLLQGKQANGLVAYGSGTGITGQISTVATDQGRASNIVADASANVYPTSGLNESTPGTAGSITGRKIVKRTPVDKRYLAGLRTLATSARGQWDLNHSSPTGYTRYDCSPNMATLAGLSSAASVYIDCPGSSGITLNGTIGAGRIFFHGFIKNGKLAMPNATQVYIDDTNDSGAKITANAITLGNNNGFCVRATSCDTLATGTCSLTPTGGLSQADLVVRRGNLNSSSGGLLRLCNTRGLLAGGQLGTATNPEACLPTSNGIAPTSTPCPGSSTPAGSSLVALAGSTDWTAPNRYGDMAGPPLNMTKAQQQTAWDGGEDLALWTETYGTGSDFKMAGGGSMHVGGVFMTPNAAPFTVTGNGNQDLTNAQFIATSFAVDGGAVLTMRVDPYNAVGLPSLYDFRMVR